ncbi:Metal-sulfur cluster biosynthetic enzyme [Natronoarchaeum philippinense]|uniref:Metal-sulfur cluster biosynthetic enzyme n=1 Tax=Natronoarchaeum philippinense TaxID=558529 RepID=A0A285P4G6_NATPI|nr:iron-sulfur cluster assembly protein [Natronoarchaeum philippinense]SNZ15056.1 Metal-sulfur cluster biosynthetic enzyme [Natronoarchaeum philippinense]
MSGGRTDDTSDLAAGSTANGVSDPADGSARVSAVRRRLDRVEDPELARSIVELDYIDSIGIDDDRVHVRFTLPTAWCSPAFAWMMAADARDEVEALEWVGESHIELCDHMHGEEITTGVNDRDTFDETFPDADGGVEAVRTAIADKARMARQRDAIKTLLEAGLTVEQIVALERCDVALTGEEAHVDLGGLSVVTDREPIAAYLRRARDSGHVTAVDDTLFLTPEGDPIAADRLDVVQKRSRLADVNMDGQGAVCDALNRARHGADGPE